ncbi:MAG: ATP-binding cassette domain-containing protein [Armatimonadota bacterium]
MANLISVRDLGCRHGARFLFQGLSFGIDEGERVGLIGPNGSGKSTLVRVLAGADKPAAGSLSARRGLHVAWVPQEEDFPPDATVASLLESAVRDLPGDEATRGATIALWASAALSLDRSAGSSAHSSPGSIAQAD